MSDPYDVDELGWAVRTEVYRSIARTGRAPDLEALSGALEASLDEVRTALHQLSHAHVLTLNDDGERIWMAHPFSSTETAFVVETDAARYWANCAWDALAIPALLGVDSRCSTRCPQTGEVLDLSVSGGRMVSEDSVIGLPVPVRAFWDDIGFT